MAQLSSSGVARGIRFLVDKWRRIGARLYLALGFAVFLTLVSSAVGVYYFEQSGDLNYQVQSESVPVLEASWTAAREAERLQALGLGLLAGPGSGFDDPQKGGVVESLERLETALAEVNSVRDLAPDAGVIQDAAYDLTAVIDDLAVNRDALLDSNAAAADLQARLARLSPDGGPSAAAASVLRQASLADDEGSLQTLWDDYATLFTAGLDPAVASLGGEQGVFAVRGQQLALRDRAVSLAAAFNESSTVLDDSVSGLLVKARAESSDTLEQAVRSFDQGRLLLTVISVVSVIAATLAAWLWVGNGMVRPAFPLVRADAGDGRRGPGNAGP